MSLKLKCVSSLMFVMTTLIVASCDGGMSKKTNDTCLDTIVADTIKVPESINVDESSKKEKKVDVEHKIEIKKTEVKDTEKMEEAPKEIGASPDAVCFLDDNENESTPKYPEGEKALKKLLKKNLRKAKKGEKAEFRASLVIKSNGSIGRVQFTECGYDDDYKEDIIAILKSFEPFIPGTKDGKAVDSWYYLVYKR